MRHTPMVAVAAAVSGPAFPAAPSASVAATTTISRETASSAVSQAAAEANRSLFSEDNYRKLLLSYTSEKWFCAPAKLSPFLLARTGFRCIDFAQIECSVCHAKWHWKDMPSVNKGALAASLNDTGALSDKSTAITSLSNSGQELGHKYIKFAEVFFKDTAATKQGRAAATESTSLAWGTGEATSAADVEAAFEECDRGRAWCLVNGTTSGRPRDRSSEVTSEVLHRGLGSDISKQQESAAGRAGKGMTAADDVGFSVDAVTLSFLHAEYCPWKSYFIPLFSLRLDGEALMPAALLSQWVKRVKQLRCIDWRRVYHSQATASAPPSSFFLRLKLRRARAFLMKALLSACTAAAGTETTRSARESGVSEGTARQSPAAVAEATEAMQLTNAVLSKTDLLSGAGGDVADFGAFLHSFEHAFPSSGNSFVSCFTEQQRNQLLLLLSSAWSKAAEISSKSSPVVGADGDTSGGKLNEEAEEGKQIFLPETLSARARDKIAPFQLSFLQWLLHEVCMLVFGQHTPLPADSLPTTCSSTMSPIGNILQHFSADTSSSTCREFARLDRSKILAFFGWTLLTRKAAEQGKSALAPAQARSPEGETASSASAATAKKATAKSLIVAAGTTSPLAAAPAADISKASAVLQSEQQEELQPSLFPRTLIETCGIEQQERGFARDAAWAVQKELQQQHVDVAQYASSDLFDSKCPPACMRGSIPPVVQEKRGEEPFIVQCMYCWRCVDLKRFITSVPSCTRSTGCRAAPTTRCERWESGKSDFSENDNKTATLETPSFSDAVDAALQEDTNEKDFKVYTSRSEKKRKKIFDDEARIALCRYRDMGRNETACASVRRQFEKKGGRQCESIYECIGLVARGSEDGASDEELLENDADEFLVDGVYIQSIPRAGRHLLSTAKEMSSTRRVSDMPKNVPYCTMPYKMTSFSDKDSVRASHEGKTDIVSWLHLQNAQCSALSKASNVHLQPSGSMETIRVGDVDALHCHYDEERQRSTASRSVGDTKRFDPVASHRLHCPLVSDAIYGIKKPAVAEKLLFVLIPALLESRERQEGKERLEDEAKEVWNWRRRIKLKART